MQHAVQYASDHSAELVLKVDIGVHHNRVAQHASRRAAAAMLGRCRRRTLPFCLALTRPRRAVRAAARRAARRARAAASNQERRGRREGKGCGARPGDDLIHCVHRVSLYLSVDC